MNDLEINFLVDRNNALYKMLSSADPCLAFYPQRLISFAFPENIDILVNQSISNVGFTVWDAEIILSSYLELLKAEFKFPGKSVLELGAGTGVAGILASKLGARNIVFQELNDVIHHTEECAHMNSVLNASFVGNRWGDECIKALLSANSDSKYDIIMLADVLYHCEDYTTLIETIICCSNSSTTDIVITFEKRRKDLSVFFEMLANASPLRIIRIHHYSIIPPPDEDILSASISLFVYHMKVGSAF